MQAIKDFFSYSLYNYPAWSYATFLGLSGFTIGISSIFIKPYLGYVPVKDIPRTYPYPAGDRPRPSGYSDENPTSRT